MNRIEAAADRIARRRLAIERLEILDPSIRPRDLSEAYAVQDAVHRRLAPTRVGKRIGWKIGATTKVMQDYLGLPHPCAAGLFEGVVRPNGSDVPAGDFCGVGIECEIAVRLARDVPPDAVPESGEGLRDAVASYRAAVELVDDRYVDWRKTDAATLIADDYFAAGAMLGPEVPAAAAGDVAACVGTTVVNGEERGRGRGADVLGHPLNALAWLARSLAERGTFLRAGEIVLTGSLVETKWLKAGDDVRVAVSGLGEIRFRVV
ncbi:MAG: fumarylacetoacetate hydrolase family protein [Rhizobiales bacterium]|nr:fumarylacetoacetate hydrolase family protein [Hyphomicrobiales bacterium]